MRPSVTQKILKFRVAKGREGGGVELLSNVVQEIAMLQARGAHTSDKKLSTNFRSPLLQPQRRLCLLMWR